MLLHLMWTILTKDYIYLYIWFACPYFHVNLKKPSISGYEPRPLASVATSQERVGFGCKKRTLLFGYSFIIDYWLIALIIFNITFPKQDKVFDARLSTWLCDGGKGPQPLSQCHRLSDRDHGSAGTCVDGVRGGLLGTWFALLLLLFLDNQ